MDELALNLALDLLEYGRREFSTARMQPGTSIVSSQWQPVDEEESMAQFSGLQKMMQVGASPIPQYLRDMINWAEIEKSKRGIN